MRTAGPRSESSTDIRKTRTPMRMHTDFRPWWRYWCPRARSRKRAPDAARADNAEHARLGIHSVLECELRVEVALAQLPHRERKAAHRAEQQEERRVGGRVVHDRRHVGHLDPARRESVDVHCGERGRATDVRWS